ncbi:TcpE family conjugal transfer membrane protein [Streptococcus infantis]|uniref:TcpE family conjugal transfer membrane protein n=1 Tax=Streptococcus infantis TaxID=68892 RepID=UPI0039C24812
MRREDKKLYVYTTAFKQPIWVHKINEDFSLPFAIKMSTIVYTLVSFVLVWFLLGYVPLLDWGFRFVASLFAGWWCGNILSENKIDGKTLFRFLVDYFKFWVEYDRERTTMYLCKGKKYEKVRRIYRGINK